MQRHWPLSDVRKGGRERGCRGKKRGLPSDAEMRGGEWIGRARIVLLVFLSRLYTMGAWAWVWWRGTRLLCQQGMQWRQPYCQTKTYQATLSVQKGKQMINIFFLEHISEQRGCYLANCFWCSCAHTDLCILFKRCVNVLQPFHHDWHTVHTNVDT